MAKIPRKLIRDIKNDESNLFLRIEEEVFSNIMIDCDCVDLSKYNTYKISIENFTDVISFELNNYKHNLHFHFHRITSYMYFCYKYHENRKVKEGKVYSSDPIKIHKDNRKWLENANNALFFCIGEFLFSGKSMVAIKLVKDRDYRFPLYNDTMIKRFIDPVMKKFDTTLYCEITEEFIVIHTYDMSTCMKRVEV